MEQINKPEQIWTEKVDAEESATMQNINEGQNEKEVKKYMRRLDRIILPAISILYFFEYLDRGNIANAKLLGLDKGHDTANEGVGPGRSTLSSIQWQTVIMIFYVGLVLCQVPGSIGYRIFPPSKWIAFGVCGWAVCSVLQVTAQGYVSLLVCRIFLGAFEGLFGTGIVYYLSLWYHRNEMGLRIFWFLGPTSIAGAFGGLIAYGVGHIKARVPNWKLLFIIEGIPCFLLGLFMLYWLPDRPTKNSRFKGRQAKIAIERYEMEFADSGTGIRKKHFVMALGDWKLYAQAAIYLPIASLISSISGFLPTIIEDLGYSTPTSANLMTVPPYAIAFFVMFTTSYTSDYYRERGLHLAVLAMVAAVMYALLAALPTSALRAKYACVCLVVPSVYALYPPSHAWVANNLGNESKRAIGLGAYTAMGNIGSIAGTFFYPRVEAPEYIKGHWVACAMAACVVLQVLVHKWWLTRENKRRESMEGPVEKGNIDVTEMADEAVGFRYIT
ncbi:MFS general substrate transporter [Pseudovirgaria hyperparasitica]|uniref:MFS general substrate transporter n=1 Tax=Pseudovirgaria hyperparasitica TaxID=470096 RepID=A0A6A6W341_9PEZI|nr:MFS general substrate transporter [Pseudovirgaria hyperparasitica]KAF2756434.1 MFS general substrate transporter [Pseudovirgaria hyperparasitica]